jgi:hypothetical protein
MADGFIVRRGGRAEDGEPTPSPTITFVSKTDSSITFTLTNNSVNTRNVTYGLTTPPSDTTVSLESLETSINQTISGLDDDEEYTIFAQAEDSAIVSLTVTTDETPVFTAATGGTTTEYDSGGKRYRSHTFTSNGTFQVTTAGNGDRNQVDYLVIAGGGSAGPQLGGGGGAGGYITTFGATPSDVTPNPKVIVTQTSYGVTIGLGGVSATQDSTSGTNSSINFSPSIVATGGGGGASFDRNVGRNGGSGGGACQNRNNGIGILGEGRNGGVTQSQVALGRAAGSGGGGAGEVGQQAPNFDNGGKGGNGLASIIRTGSSETRAGGGGGSIGGNSLGSGGAGGSGGGGAGAKNATGTAGTANTGGGGGANTASGGSGIVIIRYEIAPTT